MLHLQQEQQHEKGGWLASHRLEEACVNLQPSHLDAVVLGGELACRWELGEITKFGENWRAGSVKMEVRPLLNVMEKLVGSI